MVRYKKKLEDDIRCTFEYGLTILIENEMVQCWKCDYMICGDKDEYCRKHPEYKDAQGYRRNQ